MTLVAPNIPVLSWHGCYDGSWRSLIVPEAFSHPAKFAPGLIDRIYRYGLEQRWWKPGDTIGDPFGGIAGGGIFAGYHGLNWIGVELEERFVELGCRNLFKHVPRWLALGTYAGDGVTLKQGDSRKFAELVAADAILTSPPYADSVNGSKDSIDWSKADPKWKTSNARSAGRGAISDGYGHAVGQIGALASGDLDAVVTSPPYGRGGQGGGGDFHPDPDRHGDNSNGGSLRHGYGGDPAQIGNCTEGSLDAVVTSPPWEDQESAMNAGKFRDPQKFADAMTRLDGAGARNGTTQRSRLAQFQRQTEVTYGSADGQIGNDAGETYWHAMHQVYSQCLLALKPAGVMAVVVKDYVKDKRRVPLCDQTLRLLVHLGFEPVVRIRAMLVKEQSHTCLFGHRHTTRKERKSFFRRLAEKKGSPRIDWEEVIVVRRPA